jgi:hypothetical protein
MIGLLDNWAAIASGGGFLKGRRSARMDAPHTLLPSIMSTALEPSLLLRVIALRRGAHRREEPCLDHR